MINQLTHLLGPSQSSLPTLEHNVIGIAYNLGAVNISSQYLDFRGETKSDYIRIINFGSVNLASDIISLKKC